ncbi:sulfurtransferase [Caldalkalibacillus salinus]|uniref:sulfurtransferase n=1 Tax=Caldalkalibacillus salinus TaxID=2803787 RepID=UPI001922532C|nr:sulfurtransferase [Caldalkalibacillus salinus]
MGFKNIVSQAWLLDHLDDPKVVTVDCRFTLGEPNAGREAYLEDHLPGARYFDLERDMSGSVSTHGGRHPLPQLDELITKLGEAGIDRDVSVVAYDAQGGAMAARLWWLLKYLGHPSVYVLDGGYTSWKSNGYPTSPIMPTPVSKTFEPQLNPSLLAQMEDVKQALNQEDTVIIDSRSPERYSGEHEPVDRVGGHIPNAVNVFWKESLDDNGYWIQNDKQRKRFDPYAVEKKNTIVYCGSGVTACVNIMALDEIGITPRLYLGSWSDWISYEDTPKKMT